MSDIDIAVNFLWKKLYRSGPPDYPDDKTRQAMENVLAGLIQKATDYNNVRWYYVHRGFPDNLLPQPTPVIRTLVADWLPDVELPAYDIGGRWNGWAVPLMSHEQLRIYEHHLRENEFLLDQRYWTDGASCVMWDDVHGWFWYSCEDGKTEKFPLESKTYRLERGTEVVLYTPDPDGICWSWKDEE